jgi:coenzyme F420-0:L-glutamate ligase / coenzyme F420-1:gamma-L-glutamate ligase
VVGSQLVLTALPNVPLVERGVDLSRLILNGLNDAEITLQDDDIVVIASKVVSKAEGRTVSLDSVTASDRARELASVTGKDAREIELMLGQSSEVVRARRGLIITRHKLGFISANAGLDHSNVVGGAGDCVLLLPLDPDASARAIRDRLEMETGVNVGIIIADSHGRPHRMGTIGVAIGVAGLPALEDWRGRPDLFGYVLQHTEIGLADMIASAATLLLGQAREGTPIVHIRGVPHVPGDGAARDLVRPKEMDMFL